MELLREARDIGRAVTVLLLSHDRGLALSASLSQTLWEQGRKALSGALAAARRNSVVLLRARRLDAEQDRLMLGDQWDDTGPA